MQDWYNWTHVLRGLHARGRFKTKAAGLWQLDVREQMQYGGLLMLRLQLGLGCWCPARHGCGRMVFVQEDPLEWRSLVHVAKCGAFTKLLGGVRLVVDACL